MRVFLWDVHRATIQIVCVVLLHVFVVLLHVEVERREQSLVSAIAKFEVYTAVLDEQLSATGRAIGSRADAACAAIRRREVYLRTKAEALHRENTSSW